LTIDTRRFLVPTFSFQWLSGVKGTMTIFVWSEQSLMPVAKQILNDDIVSAYSGPSREVKTCLLSTELIKLKKLCDPDVYA